MKKIFTLILCFCAGIVFGQIPTNGSAKYIVVGGQVYSLLEREVTEELPPVYTIDQYNALTQQQKDTLNAVIVSTVASNPALSYSYQTISGNQTLDNDDVLSGGYKRWNKISTNSTLILGPNITHYGIPFIVEAIADSVYLRKGTGATFYLEGQAVGITQDGVTAYTRSPLTVISEGQNVFSIYGNTQNLITDITVNPWLIDGYWGSIDAEANVAYANEAASGIYLNQVASFGATASAYTADPFTGTYSLLLTANDGVTDRYRIGVYGLTPGEVYEFQYTYKMVANSNAQGGRVSIQNGDLSFPFNDYGIQATTWTTVNHEFTYVATTNNFIYINLYATADTGGAAGDQMAIEFDLRLKND